MSLHIALVVSCQLNVHLLPMQDCLRHARLFEAMFLTLVLARWTLPTNLGVPIFNGGSFFGEFMSSIGRNLGRFPNGPPLNDPFWYVLGSHILHDTPTTLYVPQITCPAESHVIICARHCLGSQKSTNNACYELEKLYANLCHYGQGICCPQLCILHFSKPHAVQGTAHVTVLDHACTDTGNHDSDSWLLPACLLFIVLFLFCVQAVLDSISRWPIPYTIFGTDWCPGQETGILELSYCLCNSLRRLLCNIDV